MRVLTRTPGRRTFTAIVWSRGVFPFGANVTLSRLVANHVVVAYVVADPAEAGCEIVRVHDGEAAGLFGQIRKALLGIPNAALACSTETAHRFSHGIRVSSWVRRMDVVCRREPGRLKRLTIDRVDDHARPCRLIDHSVDSKAHARVLVGRLRGNGLLPQLKALGSEDYCLSTGQVARRLHDEVERCQ